MTVTDFLNGAFLRAIFLWKHLKGYSTFLLLLEIRSFYNSPRVKLLRFYRFWIHSADLRFWRYQLV